MATEALSSLRDRTELIANIATGDSYIDGNDQLDDINEAYQETAYKYDWPQMRRRQATVIVADVDRYALPSDFRKFRYLYSEGSLKKEVEFDILPFSRLAYSVDEDSNDFVLAEIPQTASTAYTTTNGETAANAVVVELDTISGLSVGEEIWIDNTGTAEFTVVSATDTSATTITIRLKNSNTAGDKLFRTEEIVHYQYYRTITLLSGTSDVTILPNITDFVIPEYAAYLYFTRQEDPERAAIHFGNWERRLANAWLGHDKTSTGPAGQFTVGV